MTSLDWMEHPAVVVVTLLSLVRVFMEPSMPQLAVYMCLLLVAYGAGRRARGP